MATAGLLGGARIALSSTPTTTIGGQPTAIGGGKPAVTPCTARVPGRTISIGGRRYAREGIDTFAKSAPLGSFASSNPDRIVYAGDHGMAWTEYPDDWPSTYSGSAEGYQPSTVLSVHNGVLDFYLHNDSRGHPVGADPSPLPAGHRYQTYGAWSFCERVTPNHSQDLADFYQAPLLWPQNPRDWLWAESDFPEANLATLDFSGYSHYGGSGAQEVFDVLPVEPSFDPGRWHLYTQTWGPGFRSYYVDGQLVGTSSSQVWSQPERWQLQIEPSGFNDRGSGHVYVKWVWIGTLAKHARRFAVAGAGRKTPTTASRPGGRVHVPERDPMPRATARATVPRSEAP